MTTPTQSRVIAIARTWIGTPYRHQAATKDVGCDCLGLIRGIWRELYDAEPELPPPYAPDWAERTGTERLADAANRHFGPSIDVNARQPGDLILFRWRPETSAKHAGILSSDDRFIHAYEQASVVESALVPSWARRIAYVFRFPEN